MGFEIFSRKTAALTRDPIVGIQRRGTFSLNAAAVELLRKAGGSTSDSVEVELLYDPERRLIGFRPAASPANAYTVRKQPNSQSYLLSGRAFTQHYGIDTDAVKRFVATFEDGMLVINLAQAMGGEFVEEAAED